MNGKCPFCNIYIVRQIQSYMQNNGLSLRVQLLANFNGRQMCGDVKKNGLSH